MSNETTSLSDLRGATPAATSKSPTSQFNDFMARLKPQMALALPKHMNADRMARLALTAFSSSQDMQRADFKTIASSLMTAGAMGLEPGVNGAGYLIAYKGVCTFVPGWKGLVDLVSRSGRATVWTGAVFEGDDFDYALGDRPFVRHRPGDETDPTKLTHVYAVGRVNGSDYPVIEVWTMRKVWKHRDALNKQGGKHYSFRHPEMYARKVPLLQVLKYMPSSIEIANAIAVTEAAESGRGAVIDGNFVTVSESPAGDVDQETGEITQGGGQAQQQQQVEQQALQHTQAQPGDWQPSAQELEQIRQREMAEAAGSERGAAQAGQAGQAAAPARRTRPQQGSLT